MWSEREATHLSPGDMSNSSGLIRLLVVEDVFLIAGRGLILAPEVPLHLLPDESPQQITVEVRTPGGASFRVPANATIPLVDPPVPSREIAFTLLVPNAEKDSIPTGSEIWLVA